LARVAHDHTPQYHDPITLRAGDRVHVGREDTEFPGWRWCAGPDGRQGWVPAEWLQHHGAEAAMLRDYTAQELGVRAGAEVRLGEPMHGWVWATAADGRAGWIPLTCLALATDPRLR
jgi:hypothetical protein